MARMGSARSCLWTFGCCPVLLESTEKMFLIHIIVFGLTHGDTMQFAEVLRRVGNLINKEIDMLNHPSRLIQMRTFLTVKLPTLVALGTVLLGTILLLDMGCSYITGGW